MEKFEKRPQFETKDLPPIQTERLDTPVEPMEMSVAGVPEGNELVAMTSQESQMSTEMTERRGQVFEGELLSPESLKNTEAEPATSTDPEALEGEVLSREIEMTKTENRIAHRKGEINEMRKTFGLPPTEEDPPSVSIEREQLRRIEDEHEELVNVRYGWNFPKKRRVFLQSKLNSLFEELDTVPESDFELSFRNGYRSKSLGNIEPEIATYLAERYRSGKSAGGKKGSWSLAKLFKDSPEMLKTIEQRLPQEDENITSDTAEEVVPDVLEVSPETPALEDTSEQVPQLEELSGNTPMLTDSVSGVPQLEDLTKKQGTQVVAGTSQK
jgi:hypothetical protein